MRFPAVPAADAEPGPDASSGRRRRGGAAPAVAGVLLAAAVAACTSLEVSGPENLARMQFDLRVPGATASSSADAGLTARPAVTVSDPNSDLSFTIDSVDLVVRELQAGQQGEECLFAGVGGSDGGDASSCEEFNSGTIVQTMPVDEGTRALTIIRLEPGTWDHLAFQFNVLERDQNEDIQILGNRPDMEGASVFVQATINGDDGDPGNDQVVELRLAPEGERVLTAPEPVTLEVEEQGVLTLTVDVGSWFDDGNGGVLDPSQVAGNSTQRSQVVANIDASLGVEFTPPSGQ